MTSHFKYLRISHVVGVLRWRAYNYGLVPFVHAYINESCRSWTATEWDMVLVRWSALKWCLPPFLHTYINESIRVNHVALEQHQNEAFCWCAALKSSKLMSPAFPAHKHKRVMSRESCRTWTSHQNESFCWCVALKFSQPRSRAFLACAHTHEWVTSRTNLIRMSHVVGRVAMRWFSIKISSSFVYTDV